MCLPAPNGLETAVRYMKLYFTISHLYIICHHEDVHISKPTKHEAPDEVAADEHGDQQWLDFWSRLARVRDHALAIIRNGQAEEVSLIWISFHSILKETQGGFVYCQWCG